MEEGLDVMKEYEFIGPSARPFAVKVYQVPDAHK